MNEDHKGICYMMILLLFVSMFLVATEAAEYVFSNKADGYNGNLVVIDAGHGSDDSGKVGINGALEKDINLAIALRVCDLLKNQGVTVCMTREDDRGMYPVSGENRKLRDMEKRVEFINKKQAALTVSIHQNSYTEENVRGAQVFYLSGSEEGKLAAGIFQSQMIESLDKANHRQAKENSSYYLLKNSRYPTVIVECGFLSNKEEAELLCKKEYQEQVAWAIHLGIMRYLNHIKQAK